MIAECIVSMMVLAPTDQTVQVSRGTKIDINNFAGDVNVKVWDRDAVRVQVNHSDRETVDIRQGDQMLTIRSRSTRGGPPRSLDYNITIPSWMAVNVSGPYAEVSLDGVAGDVTVETTHGDITVRGGSGFVSLRSVQGEISLERAKGRIEVRAVNESIRLADISGDLSAESTNGSIILDRVDSNNVDLYTVNGNIAYDGPIKDKGLYRLTTHNGMIAVPIAARANATLTARTYNGAVRSTFPLAGDSAERRGKRVVVTLGDGSAHVELESFRGTISLRRPGEPQPEVERRRGGVRDKDKTKDKDNDAAGAGAQSTFGARRQLADGQSSTRIDEIRGDLGQWCEHEWAHVEPRMRQHKATFVGDDAAKQDEIQIKRPGRMHVGSLATALPLDHQQRIEKRTGRQICQPDGGGIEIGRLRGRHVDRGEFVIPGHRQFTQDLVESGNGVIEVRGTFA